MVTPVIHGEGDHRRETILAAAQAPLHCSSALADKHFENTAAAQDLCNFSDSCNQLAAGDSSDVFSSPRCVSPAGVFEEEGKQCSDRTNMPKQRNFTLKSLILF